MSISIKAKDLNFGLEKEFIVLDTLKKYYPSVQKTKDKYCLFDFESNSSIFELKSRRILKDTFPDILINTTKIKCLLNNEKKGYVLFNLYDGLYKFRVSNKSLKDCSFRSGGRTDRGCCEINDCVFIPTRLLRKIC
jgi:hypothetical protein